MSDERGRSAGTRKNWFKTGRSGNPSGTKKPTRTYGSFTKALRAIGFEVDPDPDSNGASNLEVAARVMWWHANHGFNGQGSPKTIETIADRLDGRPTETIELNANVTQLSQEERAQQVLATLERLKKHEDSGDTRVN